MWCQLLCFKSTTFESHALSGFNPCNLLFACRVSVYPAVANAATNARYSATSSSGSVQSGTYTGGALQVEVSTAVFLPCWRRLALERTAACALVLTVCMRHDGSATLLLGAAYSGPLARIACTLPAGCIWHGAHPCSGAWRNCNRCQ